MYSVTPWRDSNPRLGTSSFEIKILFHTQLHTRGNYHTRSSCMFLSAQILSTIAGVSLVWQD